MSNPFESPQAHQGYSPPHVPPPVPDAALPNNWNRFFAELIDSVIVAVVLVALFVPVGMMVELSDMDPSS